MRNGLALGAALLALATYGTANAQADPASVRPPVEQAPIALLVDMGSGQTLFSREADRRFVPASITKVMTAFVAFEWLDQGRLRPTQTMTVRPDTFRKWSRVGSTMFLPHDARVTVDQLLHGITSVSANDASVVLAEGAAGSLDEWQMAMNSAAADLGMADSHFGTPNGWPDEAATYTTARDLVTLGEALISRHGEAYRHFFGKVGYSYNGITQPNYDPMLGVVAGADGLKTGFTNQAGYGYLGSAERDGRRLLIVVAGSDTGRGRARAARELIEWGFDAFETRALFSAGQTVGHANVQGGDATSVALEAARPIYVTVPAGSSPTYSLSIRYKSPVPAPIEAGDRIASLHITLDGEETGEVPLLASKSVGPAGLFDRMINGFAGWLR